jgi:hypothetical protein
LTALKKNRAEFIKPADVQILYIAIVKQGTNHLNGRFSAFSESQLVTKLNDVRDGQKPTHNRLDTALADVFNLLSLFFLTIGKTREIPAIYCQLVSIRVRLILLLFYLEKDGSEKSDSNSWNI